MRVTLSLAVLACCAALVGVSAGQGAEGGAAKPKRGGTFRVIAASPAIDYVDPALAYRGATWQLLDATCTNLMGHPDEDGRAGLRLVTEAAVRPPGISKDSRTYTFTVRKGLQFSNRDPVLASAFKRAIARVRKLGPGSGPMELPGWRFVKDIADVTARGRLLRIKLKQPKPDLPARTTMPFFCAVPPQLPVDPEGEKEFAGSGPYFIDEYVPGRRVLLRRNRFYAGPRPQWLDAIRVDITAPALAQHIDLVDQNRADYATVPSPFYDASLYQRLIGKYGVNNNGRFWIEQGLTFRQFALNSSRRLFRTARMRRAVNFAVDRAAVRRAFGTPWNGSTLTDQYLPPSFPGFRPTSIYPLTRSSLRKARALAEGYSGSRKAVLYAINLPNVVAGAQAIQQALQRIGLEVEIKAFPFQVYLDVVARPGEPYDIAYQDWNPDYLDPAVFLNAFFDGGPDDANLARFHSRPFIRRLRKAARMPAGPARYRAYGQLDVDLARNAAPAIAIDNGNVPTLLSNRVDPQCVVLRPTLDLAAVCLKR